MRPATTVPQGASTLRYPSRALGLRGKNLRWSRLSMMETIDRYPTTPVSALIRRRTPNPRMFPSMPLRIRMVSRCDSSTGEGVPSG